MDLRRLSGTLLIAALVGLTGCSTVTSAPPAAPAASAPASAEATALGEDLGVADFASLVEQPGVVVLDVRTADEFASGHLPDAINIDINDAGFTDQIASLDADATYAIYCRSGNRSRAALQEMQAAGFANLHHLSGGIGAWQSGGHPVVT